MEAILKAAGASVLFEGDVWRPRAWWPFFGDVERERVRYLGLRGDWKPKRWKVGDGSG